jgi:glutamine synthetase
VLYDPIRPWRLSRTGEHFVGGILAHLPILTAITAPSVPSYYRLRPDRWAPTWANIGLQDRGAALRICPIFGPPAAHNFNVEYRVADAASSPYMTLGALVWAGLDGIKKKTALPAPGEENFWEMSDSQRDDAGAGPLPGSLNESLELLAASENAPS